MSGVRVLVGTRKGAFILTSDGKREKWDVSGPHFAGWEMYHLKGSPGRTRTGSTPRRPAAGSARSSSAPTTAARPGSRSATSSPTRATRHPPVVRRHPAPVGVQARLASRAVADRSRHGLCRRRGCRPLPLDRRRPDVARAGRAAATTDRATAGSPARAACACTPSSSTRPTRTACTSRSRRPAPSAPTTAARPGRPSTAGSSPKYIPDPNAEVGHCVHRIAMHPSRPTSSSCRSTGT